MAKANKGTQSPVKSGRTRVIFLFIGFVVLIVGGLIAFFALKARHQEQEVTIAKVKVIPKQISATPGGANKSTEVYRENIRTYNQQQAEQALRQGKSSVPYITQSGYVAGQVDFGSAESPEAIIPGCNPKELAQARKAGVRVDELRCKGCTASQLNAAGYSAGELVQAGFTAKDLKDAGYTADQLKEAGLSAKDLFLDAGYGINELKIAGYSAADLKNAGVTDVKALLAAGYTPTDLRTAGFTANDLTAVGVGVDELKKAGYSPTELKKAGFTAMDLVKAGYTPFDLVNGGYSEDQMSQAEITAEQIKEAKARVAVLNNALKDCNPKALTQAKDQGLSASDLRRKFNCPATAFRKAGYSVKQLRDAGFTGKELKGAGYTALELRNGGFTAKELKDLGFNATDLKNAGFTPGDLFRVGFTPQQLAQAPFSAAELHDAGLSVEELKAAGFKASDLKAAGYSDGDMIRAGYTPAEVAVASKEMAAAVAAAEAAVPPASSAEPAGLPPLSSPGTSVSGGAGIAPTPSSKATPLGVKNKLVAEGSTTKESLPGLPGATENLPVVQPADTLQNAIGGSSQLVLPPQEARAVAAVQNLQQKQAKQMTMQQREETLRQIQSGMQGQAQELIGTWNPPPIQQVVRGSAGESSGGSAGGGNAPGATGSPSQNGGVPMGPPGQPPVQSNNDATILKAGTIQFATLDVGINSDEQSPILATIVQEGPLKGGRLLGQFSRVDKKVLISFNTLSLPSLQRSISINAVAIDPETARTAVATNVNNHYMLRYGSLFASSVLQGLAEAVASSGSTTVFEQFGTSSTQNPTFSALDKGIIALGNVGTNYAATMGQNFQKPPTVTVDSGAPIGILLMSDLTLPKS